MLPPGLERTRWVVMTMHCCNQTSERNLAFLGADFVRVVDDMYCLVDPAVSGPKGRPEIRRFREGSIKNDLQTLARLRSALLFDSPLDGPDTAHRVFSTVSVRELAVSTKRRGTAGQ